MSQSPNLCLHCGASDRFAQEIRVTSARGADALPIGFFNKRTDTAGTEAALQFRAQNGAALCAGATRQPATAAGGPPVLLDGNLATPVTLTCAAPAHAKITSGNHTAKLDAFPMFRIEMCAGCGHVEWFVPKRFLNPVKTRFHRAS